MRKRRLAPSLVVTLSAVACNTTATKPTVATADPTPSKLDAAPTPTPTTTASAAPRKRTPHEAKAGKPTSYPEDATSLNPQDPQHGDVYVGWDGTTCFVKMPFPPGTKLTSWRPQPTQTVDCPPAMDDAAWDQCRGGTISKPKSGGCVCTMDGNPPPPPAEVECPK